MEIWLNNIQEKERLTALLWTSGWFFIVGISDMKYFLRKKSNRVEKVVFINETELKPKGCIVFGRCPAHGVLYAHFNFENFQERFKRLLPSDFFENISIWDMGNYCFPSSGKVKIESNVVGDNRLIPEGKITLFYSKEFAYYMLKFELGNFEMYFFRLWPEGQRSLCDSTEYLMRLMILELIFLILDLLFLIFEWVKKSGS